jgi:DNA-directed RNA polymerase alpha subunit
MMSRRWCSASPRAKGPVTAADSCRRRRAYVDTTHHLFTLQDDRDINVDLYVNKGRGYIEADQHPIDRGLPVDLVRIDSIYNPVRRANFTVAETRVGQRTDYDRLTLTVETNGTISPEEAVSYARPPSRRRTSSTSSSSARIRRPRWGRPVNRWVETPPVLPSCSEPRSTISSSPFAR